MQDIIVAYFSKLFTASPDTEYLSAREKMPEIKKNQNIRMSIPITNEEVKHAVVSMYLEKSPGCDRLNPGFY